MSVCVSFLGVLPVLYELYVYTTLVMLHCTLYEVVIAVGYPSKSFKSYSMREIASGEDVCDNCQGKAIND